MFKDNAHRKYKVAHARDRIRYSPEELRQFKKEITGKIETRTVLSQAELKIIQEMDLMKIEKSEAAVVNAEIDKSYIVPVYNTKTGERRVIAPKQPNPIYYEEHPKAGMTIRFCRLMGLASCILLLVLNIYFSFMWIYSDYFFPIELVRVLFSQESHPICRYALEFRSNLAVGLISFMYSMWGIGVSTVFTFPVIITAFFTWSPIFIIPLFTFAGVQVYNLLQLNPYELKKLLQNSLSMHRYKDSMGLKTAWNQAQYSFKCCGINSYTDWYRDWGFWINRTDKPLNPDHALRLPESCCPDYSLKQDYGYIVRTRSYAIRMLYCQYFPKFREGCFTKIFVFFQTFTEQLIWIALFKILVMILAAGWTYAGHVRYKRHTKMDHNYRYTCCDWILDFFCIRCCCKVKDSRKKKVGPAPLNFAFDDRPVDQNKLEQRRPRFIEDLERIERHKEEDEEAEEFDEGVRQYVAAISRDPIIETHEEEDDSTMELKAKKQVKENRKLIKTSQK